MPAAYYAVKGPWFDVPAGTRPSQCRGATCRATIYWIDTPKGKKLSVDVDRDGGFAPTERDAGRGVSHWGTCPDVAQFRRTR